MIQLIPKLYQRWFKVPFFGGELNIRYESEEFKQDIRRISNAIDDDNPNAKLLVAAAYKKYGYDPEIIRLSTLDSFLNED